MASNNKQVTERTSSLDGYNNPRLLIDREDLAGRVYRRELGGIRTSFKQKHTQHRVVIGSGSRGGGSSSRSNFCVLHWSCNGERLACGSEDKSATVFQAAAGRLQEESRFTGHGDSLERLCWHPTDPNLFVTATVDKTIRIWDVRKRTAAHIIHTQGCNINLGISPDGKYVTVGSRDDYISVYPFSMTSKERISEASFKIEVNEFAWDIHGRFLHLTAGNGEIVLLSWPELKKVDTLQAHKHCISISFDPRGLHFSVGSADTTISNWCAKTYSPLSVVRRMQWPVRTVEYNSEGKLLAAASEDTKIDISHPEKGVSICTIPTDEPVYDVAWHPTRNMLFYCCDEKKRDMMGCIHLFEYDIASSSSSSSSSSYVAMSSSISVVNK